MQIDIHNTERSALDLYKLFVGLVNPRPIAMVSTISADGILNLAPFSFFNMVSAFPPILQFCPALDRHGRPKHTLANIQATGEFVVATVTTDIAERMVRAAANLPAEESEFEFAGFTPTPATKVKPPLVKESHVNFECTIRDYYHTGDHPGAVTLVFGDIIAMHIDDAILDEDGLPDPHKYATVGRLGGQYYANVAEPYELLVPKVE